MKQWLDGVEAWWTGLRKLHGAELEANRKSLKNAYELFSEPGDKKFDENVTLYKFESFGARVKLLKMIKKFIQSPVFSAIVGAVAAWLLS